MPPHTLPAVRLKLAKNDTVVPLPYRYVCRLFDFEHLLVAVLQSSTFEHTRFEDLQIAYTDSGVLGTND